MDEYFKQFIENISLTSAQKDDAMTKYKWVCRCLYKEFYWWEYSESSKYLFWSYKKKTTINSQYKDVDVIFKIPKDEFEKYKNQESWPSNLLTRVKNTLKKTYSTTDNIKNRTKVVLVDFTTFKVEVLPALEQEDWKFTIPNSWEGEDWQVDFDPKLEVNNFYQSNKDTKWLTRNLIKIIKKWKDEKSWVVIKSYIIDSYVIDFLNWYSFVNYAQLISDFFEYLYSKLPESYVKTAYDQSTKALKYYNWNDIENAVEEYIKIFWTSFPKYAKTKDQNDIAPNEEFIENIVFVDLNPEYKVQINCEVLENWFRKFLLLFSNYPLFKDKELRFFIEKCNIQPPYKIKRKVRNHWEEAKQRNDLRGEITDDNWKWEKEEHTKYFWEHFVDCYIIKDNICVAKSSIKVPIRN